jgi:plastocyanin
MNKLFSKSIRRPTWLACVGLCILVFALAACGGDSGNGSANSSSGATATPASVATVMIKETKGSGPGDQGDVYSCDPTTLTVHKGDTVTFTNQSDQTQDFDQGDAQKAGVDFVMAINQSTTVKFNVTGTFTIKSEKGATITVTVQ